ncbi:hypothetical protein C0Q70_09566 [Pomacea canaliculata]|uniref:SWIM-type domain-containing protein n=1 Tax=Pomacea canaliculata TaxID=400727 RepID=A0A2T7PA62_POMCA|nr:uncharacterized protein C2orf42-like isoform X2 [Pomacea canaliculata]PVD30302.1 hypothetical protein C0Q70_09566 [Pomacea canaliculata]
MAAPDKLKALFEDLGKPTLRGVRKCPKCGTFNGTRGISCKNKACDVIFKEKESKKGHSVEAVKIITGSTVQVFSVRLRDRGPDYRGFVQLPLVQDQDGNLTSLVDPLVLAQAARCYVESCNRNNSSSDIVSAVKTNICSHVKAAIECAQEAQPLTLKNSVLNSLQVSNEIKQAIWLLATETTGPLIQRVTKNIMVVKCKPNPKQPLGFLHFAFFETTRNRQQTDYKIQCSCKAFRSMKPGSPRDDLQRRCVHFYACVCAFASDDKLAEEFSYYIHLDTATTVPTMVSAPVPEQRQVLTVYHPMEGLEGVGEGTTLEVIVTEDLLAPSCEKKPKKDDTLAQASSALLTLQDQKTPSHLQPVLKASPPKQTLAVAKAQPAMKKTDRTFTTPPQVDENTTSLSFQLWLASVTERINQTMHYQFDGNPDPLVFHAPQFMFDCLQQRISAGSKKKRLPNYTTGFVRRDALPLGTFTKYTWHITNILHVKQIFDTPEMPLEITRSFVENRDGTYDPYEVPKVAVEPIEETFSVNKKNQTPIRPFELKTFLKVGTTTPDQKEPTPFIIEWIPDILPKSHIGELRIKLEYGHQRNGQIEHRVWSPPTEIPIQTIHVQEIG